MSLDELCRLRPAELLGSWCRTDPAEGFPLLIKWLDCQDWLSIQVHPDDEVARRLSGQPRGKCEAWMFWTVRPGAEAIHGWQKLPAEMPTGRGWNDYVRRFQPEPQSWVYTPPGTIHALGPGLLVFEVQQSSDLTYRVYDWDRLGLDGKPRPLHEKEAEVAIRDSRPENGPDQPPGLLGELQVSSPYFLVERVRGQRSWSTQGQSFEILTAFSEDCSIRCGAERWPLPRFESLLVPAGAEPLQGGGEDWLRVRLAPPPPV